MKRLNRKGFAISTVIYGLSIMGIMIVAIVLAVMAQNRSNNSQLAKSIEEDLNRFSRTDTSFRANGNIPTAQEYIVPEAGWYRIELWGSKNGGNGAYTSGIIRLAKDEKIYFYVGKNGAETDVRVVDGEYAERASYIARFMVAAGGGSGTNADGGTLVGYSARMKSQGGFVDTLSTSSNFGLLAKTASGNTTNGSLIGFPNNYSEGTNNYNGKEDEEVPSPRGNNGGGDGMIPGSNSSYGGVSYIAGYGGCLGVSDGVFTKSPMFVYSGEGDEEEEQSEEPGEDPEIDPGESGGESGGDSGDDSGDSSSGYYFFDGFMLAGVNNGDGFAKISKVSDGESIAKKNTKLNNVRYIRDCISINNLLPEGATLSPLNAKEVLEKKWKISAISEGIDIINDREEEFNLVPDELKNMNSWEIISGIGLYSINCRYADLGDTYDLDEIDVWHEDTSGIDPMTHNIFVSSTGYSNMTSIKGEYIQVTDTTNKSISETETPTGIRISAYQSDSLPSKGRYIIIPVLSENKVLTAGDGNNLPIGIEYYNGYNRQVWEIEPIDNGNYKLLDQSGNRAMTLDGSNAVFNRIITNGYSDLSTQKWSITKDSLSNTYYIKTVVSAGGHDTVTGYILPQTNQSVNTSKDKLIIGKRNAQTTRFKLISIDY